MPWRHRCRQGCLSGGSLRFGVLFARRMQDYLVLLLPATFSLFCNGICGATSRRSPLTFANGSSSRTLHASSEYFRSRACPTSPDAEPLLWGCLPSSRHQSVASVPLGSTPAAFPFSTFLTPSTVSATTNLGGLFHPSATARVRSSGGFPSRTAEPPRRRPVPSCRLAKVRCWQLPTSATNLSPAFRALLRTRIRCLYSGV